MHLMSQFGKVHLYGLMRSVEYSLERDLVGEVPPTDGTLLGHHFIVCLGTFRQCQFLCILCCYP